MLKYFVFFLVCLEIVQGQGLSSCIGRCDDYVDNRYTCQCNSYCEGYGDCCSDYSGVCLEGTCSGRCDTNLDASEPCQCNSQCTTYGDCCSDYSELCEGSSASCAGLCDTNLDPSRPCQCNSQCLNYGDCCNDYSTVCNSPGGGGGSTCASQSVSNTEVLDVSLELFDLDVNRAGPGDITVNMQALTSDSSTQDNSPENFFTYVDEDIFQQPSYQSFINLLDNYQNIEGINEDVTASETDEIYAFLDTFMTTEIGKRLYTFLESKNLAGCSDEETFKENLKKMWFDLYSRQNNAMDTSGFEHAFVGEIKTNIVSGFHNWVQFYLQEKAQKLNYYGYTGKIEPELYGLHFEWDGFMKGLSGSSVGSSPEYDLAIFTLCHVTRPGSICKVSLRDSTDAAVTRSIQTWTWTKTTPGSGLKYVASAYFLI